MSRWTEYLNQLAGVWSQYITSLAVQATVVACLLLLVCQLLKRKLTAGVLHAVLLIALLKLAAPPVWTPSLSSIPWSQVPYATPHVTSSVSLVENLGISQVSLEASSEVAVNSSANWNSVDQYRSLRTDGPLANSTRNSALDHSESPMTILNDGSKTKLSASAWLMLAHLSGAVVILAALLTRLVHLKRITNRSQVVSQTKWRNELDRLMICYGISGQVRLLESAETSVLICFGVFKPTVIVPTTVVANSELAEPVLAHELAHICRRDTWVNSLQNLLFVVWWFHPLFWIVNRQRWVNLKSCWIDPIAPLLKHTTEPMNLSVPYLKNQVVISKHSLSILGCESNPMTLTT